MNFRRCFSDPAIKNMSEEKLFKERLRDDVRQNNVFPAVREGRMDFYYKGGLLFSYDGSRFATDPKHASIINGNDRGSHAADTSVQEANGYVEEYARIKELCSLYSNEERKSVSQLYEKYSCAKQERSDSVVVLDIEICMTEDSGQHTIDLLLFDTESGALRFFEAKGYWNKAIRAKEGDPDIVEQMNRYKDQLNADDNVRNVMLENYRAHRDIINQLFEPKPELPMPKFVDPIPRLLIFGFDEDQRRGKLKGEIEILEGNPDNPDMFVYAIGDIERVELGDMFSGGNKHWPLTLPES